MTRARNLLYFWESSWICQQATTTDNKNVISPWPTKATPAITPSIMNATSLICESFNRFVFPHTSWIRTQSLMQTLPGKITISTNFLIHSFGVTSHSHPQSTNGSEKDISHVITIYHDVVNNIKQNCIYNMICQRCMNINWLLEEGQEPRSMADI